MKKIAIIPARGGSKRIPRKNIKPFLGKPIIAYSIEAALTSGLFDEVMVSTDDEEIATIAKQYGAEVPFFRSERNSDDYATTVEVLIEVLDCYNQQGIKFEIGCCIYPTAPFVTSEKLEFAHHWLSTHHFDSVFPVLPFSFPIQRAIKINRDRKIEMFEPEHLTTRSQDLEPSFHDSGQFYWFNIKTIRQKKKLWTNNTGVIHLTEMEAHDIDNPIDWRIAEFKYQLQHSAIK